MEFIANYWFVWLLGMILCGIYTIFNQVRRMKNMGTGMARTMSTMLESNGDPNSAVRGVQQVQKSFFSGLMFMLMAGLMASFCSILFAISVVIHIVEYIQTA